MLVGLRENEDASEPSKVLPSSTTYIRPLEKQKADGDCTPSTSTSRRYSPSRDVEAVVQLVVHRVHHEELVGEHSQVTDVLQTIGAESEPLLERQRVIRGHVLLAPCIHYVGKERAVGRSSDGKTALAHLC